MQRRPKTVYKTANTNELRWNERVDHKVSALQRHYTANPTRFVRTSFHQYLTPRSTTPRRNRSHTTSIQRLENKMQESKLEWKRIQSKLSLAMQQMKHIENITTV